ncbi:MAG TPA: leucyl/phenylalanyl-tRNA--protein transferase [Phycisphaerales bacterium]|nr:leucyl/phenylalanyl-tRNA--protein transferase [Phycisphaerales bacterium]HMP38103.1 leucyl/phenylalanyl-tRNA--protein transferase [Phycisphaerales bacterium]
MRKKCAAITDVEKVELEPARKRAASRRPDDQRPDARVLLGAYSMGIFPMADRGARRIDWYRPDPRGILPLDGLRVPRSLRRVVDSGRFEIRFDCNPMEVLRACAGTRGPDNPGWMSERLAAAYAELSALGFLHSVESWSDGRLVGGLYGVAIGGAFFGESMFVRPELGGRDASKVALVHLVERLRTRGFALLDTQVVTPHMGRLGAVEIGARDYDALLAKAIALRASWE